MKKPPNILYIMTDQHHAGALGCAGHPVVQTPHLDRLAGDGVRFDRAFCPSPVCGPSRAALFSGLYPHVSGRVTNHDTFTREVALLPDLLRRNGYHTALAGKLHLAPIRSDHGFEEKHLHDAGYDLYDPDEPATSDYVRWLADRRFGGDVDQVVRQFNADEDCLESDTLRFILGTNWRSEEEHSNTWVTERALDCLRAPREKPFFLFVSYFGPHQPMMPPEPWASRYDPRDVPLPPEFRTSVEDKPIAREIVASHPARAAGLTEDDYRRVLAAYYGQISMIDQGIGRILDELKTQGVDDNTIVVFTADHGDHAGQFGLFFKSTMYQGAVQVPLIVRDPACGRTAGARCDRVVNNLDLYLTLLERAGVDAVPPSHSRSLHGLLADVNCPAWPDHTYSELRDLSMVAADRWKLIRRNGEAGELHELYDLTSAVADDVNLWDRPEHAGTRQRLLELLNEYARLV